MNSVIETKGFGLVRRSQILNDFLTARSGLGLAEMFAVFVSSILFVFSIYAVVSDRFWLGHIDTLTDGLVQIGKITENTGSSIKRTTVDPLWLPLFNNTVTYLGDTIKTGERSKVKVVLNSDISFWITENSLIRIKILDGKPLLRLQQGTVVTDFLKDQVILIKKGAKIEEITIHKGNYQIKSNTSTGDISLEFSKVTKSSGEKIVTKKTNTTVVNESDLSLDDNASPTPNTTGIAQNDATAIIYNVPYPDNNTVFLIKKPKKIPIAGQITCPDNCTLKVYHNKKVIFELLSTKGESAFVELQEELVLNGTYEWEYASETKNHKATFFVESYSNEALSQAIEHGYPVEIY